MTKNRGKVAQTRPFNYRVYLHVRMYCGFIPRYLCRCYSSFYYFPIDDYFSRMCKFLSIWSLFRFKYIYIASFYFLAHLSWKLKWAILIAFCPSSVCKFLHFRLLLQNFVQRNGIVPLQGEIIAKEWKCTENFKNLLQNQRAKFNQTWYKLSLGHGNSKFFKLRARSSSKGR